MSDIFPFYHISIYLVYFTTIFSVLQLFTQIFSPQKQKAVSSRQPLCDILIYAASALEAHFLTLHIFNDNIVDFTKGCTVLQHLPGLIGMVVDFD